MATAFFRIPPPRKERAKPNDTVRLSQRVTVAHKERLELFAKENNLKQIRVLEALLASLTLSEANEAKIKEIEEKTRRRDR